MDESKKKNPKRKIANWSAEDMRRAVSLVLVHKFSIRDAAKMYKIKPQTLHGYVKKQRNNPNVNIRMEPNYESRQIFKESEEKMLVGYLQEISNINNGISLKKLKQLVYDIAKGNKMKVPKNWKEKRMAGAKWVRGFMRRNPSLVIKKKEISIVSESDFIISGDIKSIFKTEPEEIGDSNDVEMEEEEDEDDMKKFQYSEQQMLSAIQAVHEGLSIHKASRDFQVPYSTLSDKVRGKTPINRTIGPPTVLPDEDEQNLVQWMLKADAAGFPITKCQLIDSAQKIIKDKELETCFVNGRPGRRWHENFMKRHPELLERSSPNTFLTKSDTTYEHIQDWFHMVYKYLQGINIHKVLENSNRVFICEESTIFLNLEERSKVMVKRADKVNHNVDERERMTAVLLANAAGTLAPPLIVSKCQRLSKLMKGSIPVGWEVGRSENGWATAENFLDYIVKVFYPWLMSERITLPIILFLDATASPLTYSLSEFCQRYGVILVALYPNNDHVPRPLDVSFYQCLKREWDDVFRIGKMTKGIKREEFCPLFREVLNKIDVKCLISSGFESCGLFPFNVEKQPSTKSPEFVCPVEEVDPNDKLRKLNLLRGIEEMIGDKVILFENSGEQWVGRVEDTSLFELWSQLKRESGEIDDLNIADMVFVKTESTSEFDGYEQVMVGANMDIVKSEND